MRIRPLPIRLFAPEEGTGAPPAPATPPPDAPASAAPPEDISLLDAVDPASPPPAADGKPQRPADLPEQFWDADKGEVRLDQLSKSWRDLRTKVARGEGVVPDKPEAYTLPQIEGLPADIVKADDPLWVEVRTAAHAAGVTEKQLHALVKPYLAAAAKAQGAAPPPADPAAAEAARRQVVEQEMAKLGPNGRQVVADIRGWIAGLEARGGLAAEEAKALRMMGGSAEGVRALAKLRELSGAPAIPTDAMATDTMSQADAARMMQEGFRTNDMAKVERARTALKALEAAGRLKNPMQAA